ncbi:tautomerase family protein [Burkholderia sp. Ac-20379]|uniref:tautomerase family protein n=1 Tax=Burkholderia sp. Ac-20379 TaxID=2703900 RepID=UPI0019817FE7|nr:tautomerase family protein [Burkholderia sp. Ac-20379]MBN3726976.1 tautomerase family protein [Burkholderia sp. Ac-20379]
MPFYTLTLMQGSYDTPDTLLGAIRSANIAAGYPADDVFQRVVALPPSHLVIDKRYPDLPRDRSARLLTFEILISAGTSEQQKHRVRTELVRNLTEVGVDANDIIVFFLDYDRVTSSFGGGKTPPPLHLTR